MLETSDLARKYTPILSFRKYTLQYLGPLNFADVSIFLQKLAIFIQKSTFTQSNSVRAMLDFLVLFSVFARQKVTVNENINFADSVSGIWPPDCTKLAKNQENGNDVKIFRQDAIVNFLTLFCFSCQFQLLVQVSWRDHLWFWNYDNFLLRD